MSNNSTVVIYKKKNKWVMLRYAIYGSGNFAKSTRMFRYFWIAIKVSRSKSAHLCAYRISAFLSQIHFNYLYLSLSTEQCPESVPPTSDQVKECVSCPFPVVLINQLYLIEPCRNNLDLSYVSTYDACFTDYFN